MKITKCFEQSTILFYRVTKRATDPKPAIGDKGEDVGLGTSYFLDLLEEGCSKLSHAGILALKWKNGETLKKYRSDELQYQETSIIENSNFGISLYVLFFYVKLFCLRHEGKKKKGGE